MRLRYLGRLFLGRLFTKSLSMHQCGVLTCYGITLIVLDSDHTVGVRHLQCGVGTVDDRHELQEDPVECILYRGQVLQMEAYLDEGFSS
jgi:hypothetical protein